MKKELASFAENVALSAGKIILESINNIEVDFKGKTDLITNIDLESERSIIDKIINSYPSHNILSEEHGLTNNNSDYLWVIDPLDGTTNFVHNYPSYGVSIGLLYKNNPEIIDNFLKQSKIIENDANKEHFGYTAKAGTAIVFDEGGVHKGSRPQQNDRMVLRYLYSSKN